MASDLDLHCSQRPFNSKYLGLLRYLQSSTCFHISCSFLYPNIFTLEQGINTKLTDISPSSLSDRVCYFSHLYVRYIRKTDNTPNLFFISFLFPVIFFPATIFPVTVSYRRSRCNSLSCPPPPPGQLGPRGARYPGVSCPPPWAACPPPQKTWETQLKMRFIFSYNKFISHNYQNSSNVCFSLFFSLWEEVGAKIL